MSASARYLSGRLTHSQLECQLDSHARFEKFNLQPTILLILDGLNEELANDLLISTTPPPPLAWLTSVVVFCLLSC